MIWVLSGTKDGVEIIKLLKKEGFRVFASAVTEYGAALSKKAGADYVSAKALNYKGMEDVIKKKKISALIDATHPFAVEASKNAMEVSKGLGIKYLRYERKVARIPKNALVYYAKNFEGAGKKAGKLGEVIFYTGGSKNLNKFLKATKGKKIIARILPEEKSLQKCLNLGLKPSEIIAAEGPFSEELNKAMLGEYKATVLVTKESGAAGGAEAKVKAALALNIPVVIVERPKMKYRAVVSKYADVVKWLRHSGVKK